MSPLKSAEPTDDDGQSLEAVEVLVEQVFHPMSLKDVGTLLGISRPTRRKLAEGLGMQRGQRIGSKKQLIRFIKIFLYCRSGGGRGNSFTPQSFAQLEKLGDNALNKKLEELGINDQSIQEYLNRVPDIRT